MSGEGDSFQLKKGFQWTVKKEALSEDKLLYSKNFEIYFKKQTNWYLRLRPPSNNDIWVSLYLMPGRSAAVGPIQVKVKLGLITKSGKEMNVKQASFLYDRSRLRANGWPKFIQLDSLLAEENNFFKNDKLTIFCDLEIYKTVEVVESQRPQFGGGFNRRR